jgi:ABC-type glycerol-3-phosphate transport system substrate-binding protein
MGTKWAVTLLFLVSLLLSACDLAATGTLLESAENRDVDAQVTAVTATPVATAVAPRNTPDFDVPVTTTPAAVALKLWIPPEIAVRTEMGAQLMADQLFAFNAKHPSVVIQVEQKNVSGAGGILSYLRTGRGVAPSVLPDMIAIPADLLPTAANENLIFPLDDVLDPADLDGLFPPAQQLARPQERILGYPFALTELPFLVYNSHALTSTLPLTWSRLISDTERSMVMAAGGTDGALLALQFYLDAGGTVVDELGQPALQAEPLQIGLEALQSGRDTGFLVQESSSLSTLDQSWQVFLGGGANIVRTSADYYLGETTLGLPVEFTVTPGIDRPLTPLVDGWAWAISTSDPAQRALAQELMLELVAPPNLGTWSQGSSILPAQRDALAVWIGDDAYVGFIEQELGRARPLPVDSNSKLFTVIGDAVFQVVSGSKTAQEAADDAVAAMRS